MPQPMTTRFQSTRATPVRVAGMILALLFLMPASVVAEQPRTDRLGDPLPDGAIARLGTARLRHEVVAHNPIPLAFTADGRYLVSSDGSIVYVWESHTGRVVKRWGGIDWGDVRRLVSSRDGKTIAIATTRGIWTAEIAGQGSVRVRDTWRDGEHRAAGWSAFAPNGESMISMERSTEIRVFNTSRPESRRAAYVNAMVLAGLSRDGANFTVWNQEEVEQWNFATLRRTSKVRFPYYGKFRRLRIRADGSLFAVNLDDGGIIFWDPATAKTVGRLSDPNLVAEIGMQFTPDGGHLVTVSAESATALVQTWNVGAGTKESSFKLPLAQAGEPVVSPDGAMIAFATMTNNISLRDLKTGREPFGRGGFEGAPVALSFVPGARVVAADESNICFWNLPNGELLKQIPMVAALQGIETVHIPALFVPAGAKSVIACMRDGPIREYNLKTGDFLGTYSLPLSSLIVPGTIGLSPNGRSLFAIVIAADGSRLELLQWDTATRKSTRGWGIRVEDEIERFGPNTRTHIRTIGPHFVEIKSTNSDAAPLRAADSADASGGIVVRDLANARELFDVKPSAAPEIVAGTRGVLAVLSVSRVESPNAKLITGQSFLESWELMSGNRLAKWQIPAVNAFALSPNGRTVALARGGQIEFRNLTRDSETATRTAESEVQILKFSPDGRWLASGHANGTILIWDVNEALHANRSTLELTPTQREKCWSDLMSNAKTALAASNRLADDPAGTVALLRDRLKPLEFVPPERLKPLLAKLDSPRYAERESASSELEALGERVRPALHNAMLATHSAEVRQRLSRLFESTLSISSPHRWRQFRAIALLEEIGNPEAKAILVDLSKGDPAARETQAAAEALQRISNLQK